MRSVLHLTAKEEGGAGRAAIRLHEGLTDEGFDSRVMLQKPSQTGRKTIGPTSLPMTERTRPIYKGRHTVRKVLDRVPLIPYGAVRGVSFSTNEVPDFLNRRLSSIDTDLLHLHWINDGFVRIETVGQMSRPIVWTLHDLWPATGGCHYNGECAGYQDGCGCCPLFDSDDPNDVSSKVFERKRRSWSKADITVVAPSRWAATVAEQSPVFGDVTVETIPNGLDTRSFVPRNLSVARRRLGLPENAEIVLFGALYQTEGRKGGDLLVESLNRLADFGGTEDVHIVTFGRDVDSIESEFDSTTLGYVTEEDLSWMYAAADVMVVPSRQETFGQTVTESMACGTPVVAFDATGPRDIIVHQQTGYLAEPYEPTDFARGIRWVLEGDADRLSENARKRAVEQYSIESVVEQYVRLYEDVLN